MPDEPGKTPDGETGEQPPPPRDLPGDRRTDRPGIDESAQGLGDLLDEPDHPNVLSQEETDDLRSDMVRRNLETQKAEEAAEAAEAADGETGEQPPPADELPPGLEDDWGVVVEDSDWEVPPPRVAITYWKGRTVLRSAGIIGGTALLGAAAYFIFVDRDPAVIPAQDQAIEQSAGEVFAPPEQGDAASEIAPGAAVEEQPLGQVDEVEDLPPAEESEESVAVIEPQGPIVFTMNLFGGDCPEYASEYSQTVELTAHPAPGELGLVIVMMVNPESGQAVQSAPWDPLSNDPVVMVSQDETSERYGIDPETLTLEYVFTDQDGQACAYSVEIPDAEESHMIDIFFLDLA